MRIDVCLEDSLGNKEGIIYLLKLFEKNNKISIFYNSENGIKIGKSSDADIRLSSFFYQSLIDQERENKLLGPSGYIETELAEPDYLATAFYMLNSLQEYDGKNLDSLGRFKYEGSYQYRFSNVTENIVQTCFDKIAEKLGIKPKIEPTRFFLSHDIDTVYESIIQDGFNVIKKGRFDIFIQLLFRAAMCRPDWLNMDLIMNIESEHDCRSTFFWIVNKGKVERKLANADYTFKSNKIQDIIKTISDRGFENGLHKSISTDSFKKELANFKVTPIANRYHYLKFNVPSAYDAIEEAGLKIDASLGFAETPGFRNNYGQPFNPYNIKEKRPYSFVEVPLHIMDTSLFRYKRSSVNEAEKEIFDFFMKNKSNCVLSVLWHNNFFSNYKYKGYLPFYKKILAYIQENNLRTITQQEIIDNYSITWP